jgi:hypothetical protein
VITPEQWDTHWHRIREQALTEGAQPTEAEAIADTETIEQFGPRPTEET